MYAVVRFILRAATNVRKPIEFARIHPKKVEALGILVFILAAVSQLQSDAYQRWISYYTINELVGESELTRRKIMELIICQQENNCSGTHRDWIKVESSSFIPLDVPDRYTFWQLLRIAAFIFGSCLVFMGKWFDGTSIKAVTIGKRNAVSPTYLALRRKLQRSLKGGFAGSSD